MGSAKLEKFQMTTESEKTQSETAIAKSQMPIQIFIAEGGKFHNFSGKLSDHVWEVKHAIGFAEVSMLFYKNKLLSNYLTLLDYNVQNNSTL